MTCVLVNIEPTQYKVTQVEEDLVRVDRYQKLVHLAMCKHRREAISPYPSAVAGAMDVVT